MIAAFMLAPCRIEIGCRQQSSAAEITSQRTHERRFDRVAHARAGVSQVIEDRGTDSSRSSRFATSIGLISPLRGDVGWRPQQPLARDVDSGDVNDGLLREALLYWFGYGPRGQQMADDLVHALRDGRHLLVSAPRGAATGALADLLSSAGNATVVVGDLDAALHGAGAFVRVPAIAERREDLSHLLHDARVRAEHALALGRANLRGDFRALTLHAWPGHLDEIERVMRALVAVRVAGSMRAGAAVAGMSKSRVQRLLAAVGVND